MTKKRYSPGPNHPIAVRAVGDNAPSSDFVEPIVRSILEMGPGFHDAYKIERLTGDHGPLWMLDYGGIPLAAVLETPYEYDIALCEVPQEMGLWMADFFAMACMHANAE